MKAHKSEGGSMKDEARIVRVETVIEHIQYMLDRIDKRFDDVDKKFNKLETEMKELRTDIKNDFKFFNEKIDKETKYNGGRSWVQFSFLFTMIVSVLGILAHTHGWIG